MNWLFILCYVGFLVIAGYALPFVGQVKAARIWSWLIALATVVVSLLITSDQSPILRMFIIVYLQILAMKIVVVVESYPNDNKLNFLQWTAFSLGWFGMRPILFEKLPSKSFDYTILILKGASRIIIGTALLYLSTLVEQYSAFFIPQLLLLAGFSFILHFGIMNLTTAAWRSAGIDVKELFRSPYKSKSLKEFWGKRWNVAFSEMTALVAYRPLKSKSGIETAMLVSFLLSGLLHEVAISLPVKAGYGLPMLYFAIHALAMHLETRSAFVQKLISHRILSHVWVITILVLPMPLLFHSSFIEGILVPLRDMMMNYNAIVL